MIKPPDKLEKIIERLNLEETDKDIIRKMSIEIINQIDKALPSDGDPKELYDAARHLIGKGKLIRGILVMLVNKIYEFRNKWKALKVAAAIELLHTASLIHDDIIDGAKMRRGIEAVHKKFGLNTAIIAADLLISIAYFLLSELGDKVIKVISEAGRKMSEGEVLEEVLETPSMKQYFKIVDGKSSALIEAACSASAIVSEAPENEVKAFANYGKLVGRVLQIRDDILDYVESEKVTGKTNPILIGLKKSNIVEVFMETFGLTLHKAIIKSHELGEKIASEALRELSFLAPKKRKVFEEFAQIILKRPF